MPTDRLFADWDLWEYDKLRDHFKLEMIAKENAAKNTPITSALTPDYFHNDLTSRYEKLVNENFRDHYPTRYFRNEIRKGSRTTELS